MSMQPLAFINARLVDPETGYDGPGALLTVDGTIAEVRRDGAFPGLSPDTRVIDADGDGHQHSDADGDAITYTMTGAPSGLALTTAGVLSWTKAVKGTYSLKITPKDSHGLSGAAATITLTVTA